MSTVASEAGFDQLGLGPPLLAALAAVGYEEPTPVQRAAIPPLLEGKDVLGQAATGTGKTAAFALPILQRIEPGACDAFHTSALVLVPTRELAMQVAEAIHELGRTLGVSVLPVYGGQDIGVQLRRLKRGVDVVVATPGRALDHLRRKTLELDRVQFLVLDEADEMLDLGFAEDLEALLSEVPEQTQTALFSATVPPRIATIAQRHLASPVRVRIEPEKSKAGSLPRIRQTAYVVPRAHKDTALERVLDVESPRTALIFCRTRVDAERLADVLLGHGHEAAALHGGLTQGQRDRVLRGFKSQALQLLVATDVAARGLDIEKLSHVFNYDLPTSPEPYVHRIGRTGRAGREGTAITFIEPRELRALRNIERITGQKIELGQLPTLVDLRARKLELTRSAVAEVLEAGPGEEFRRLVEALAEQSDVLEVATAAVGALHAALNPDREGDSVELPVFQVETGTEKSKGKGKPAPRRERGERRAETVGVRLFVGAGRRAGLRPGDLVGAITNEAGLGSEEVGAIQIADHYAIVEVSEARAEDIIRALRETTLRGRKVKVELYRPERGQRSRQRR